MNDTQLFIAFDLFSFEKENWLNEKITQTQESTPFYFIAEKKVPVKKR